MAIGFLILLGFQLAGELLVRWLDVPIPGSVVGMVLLFVGLLLVQDVPEGLRLVSNGLLRVLPLLLVPAGVGIMQYLDLLAEAWAELLIALSVSTFITLLLVAAVLKKMMPNDEEQQN
ncbi:CidA/LrgA family protein [Pontibacter sp. JAM-7]|uniref:CidA/LrgA family protein n=1 Tax=Pontibacter sp. JAM-7 TaxID=3366581 RepID=UPI003AF50ED8